MSRFCFSGEIQGRQVGNSIAMSGKVGVLVDPGRGVGAAVAQDFGSGFKVPAAG